MLNDLQSVITCIYTFIFLVWFACSKGWALCYSCYPHHFFAFSRLKMKNSEGLF